MSGGEEARQPRKRVGGRKDQVAFSANVHDSDQGNPCREQPVGLATFTISYRRCEGGKAEGLEKG